jgi:hypothetical protein
MVMRIQLKQDWNLFQKQKGEHVGCVDHTEVDMHVALEKIWNALSQLKQHCIKIELITKLRLKIFLIVKNSWKLSKLDISRILKVISV